jgi:hypothetical protein
MEKGFAQSLAFLLEMQRKGMIWKEAVELAGRDFKMLGISNPDQGAPVYIEKANEYYESILKNPAVRLTKKQVKEYIDNYIQRVIDESVSHETEWTYGGYNFSEAQMEVVKSFSEEAKIKIGEIMKKGLSEHKRSYQIKQDFFYSKDIPGVHGWDGEYFVALHSSKGLSEFEERTMYDYFMGYEGFETEDEARDFFSSCPYLKTHTKLKQKVINSRLANLHTEGDY